MQFGHPLLPYCLLPAGLSTGLGEQCANTVFCSLLLRIQESCHPQTGDGGGGSRALPAIQAGARLKLEQELLLLVLSLESFGVPTPCSRRVRKRKELGAVLSLSLCDRDDHSCPCSFVLSASKSYGENQNKPRKV